MSEQQSGGFLIPAEWGDEIVALLRRGPHVEVESWRELTGPRRWLAILLRRPTREPDTYRWVFE